MIRIDPLSNGQKYGWSKIRSLFDFFFPYSKNGDYDYIRAEASMYYDSKKGKMQRSFYTFRAFSLHYLLTYIVSPVKDFRKNIEEYATELGISVEWALQLGVIALDTHVSTGGVLNGVSYTVTGSNPFLVAFLEGTQNNTDNISSCTYNSVAMTNSDKLTTGAGGSAYQYSFSLNAPATGSHAFATQTTTNAYVLSYSGVKQSGQPDAHSSVNNTSSSVSTISISTTTVTDKAWVAAHFRAEGGGPTFTAGANTTFRDSQAAGASADTNGVVTPAGSVTQSVTFSATTFTSALSIAFAPGAAATTGGSFLLNFI